MKELIELNSDINSEVDKHKWVLSEKLGYDVGRAIAVTDWLEKHFASWKSHQWHKNIHKALNQYRFE